MADEKNIIRDPVKPSGVADPNAVSMTDVPPIINIPAANKYNPKQPNSDLDLSGFDYNNLSGESFKKYQELVNSLNGFQSRDFTQYFATGIFKMELNDRMDKVEVLVGIKMNKTAAINNSRMPVASARDLNKQIMDKNNPATNSRYWLLKKPV